MRITEQSPVLWNRPTPADYFSLGGLNNGTPAYGTVVYTGDLSQAFVSFCVCGRVLAPFADVERDKRCLQRTVPETLVLSSPPWGRFSGGYWGFRDLHRPRYDLAQDKLKTLPGETYENVVFRCPGRSSLGTSNARCRYDKRDKSCCQRAKIVLIDWIWHFSSSL